jgi:hypothetical protein
MTDRLQAALKRLSREQLEILTGLAESMSYIPPGVQPGEPMKLEWAGGMKDAPERSGVEAAKRANEIRIELLLKGMPK